jgi:hypothetical protein
MLGDITQYDYQPASDVESDDDIPIAQLKEEIVIDQTLKENVALDNTVGEEVAPAPPVVEEVLSDSPPKKPASSVQGFQLVQATGLTDTSTPAPKGSDIPSFATATPIPHTPLPSEIVQSQSALPTPAPAPERQLNPLEDNSKSKQFTQRTDVLFFNVVYDC